MQRVFGIIGWKNNGKTTMTVKLVAELTKRGYKIATVKHAHHNFDIDHEETDSFRHRKAGASEIAVVSSQRWAIIHEMNGEAELTLSDIVAKLSPCDLVIVEGYKNDSHDKLEVRRQEGQMGEPIWQKDCHVVALASDQPIADTRLPIFELNDINAIADFVETHMGLAKP